MCPRLTARSRHGSELLDDALSDADALGDGDSDAGLSELDSDGWLSEAVEPEDSGPGDDDWMKPLEQPDALEGWLLDGLSEGSELDWLKDDEPGSDDADEDSEKLDALTDAEPDPDRADSDSEKLDSPKGDELS
jgi:hypothetical protein